MPSSGILVFRCASAAFVATLNLKPKPQIPNPQPPTPNPQPPTPNPQCLHPRPAFAVPWVTRVRVDAFGCFRFESVRKLAGDGDALNEDEMECIERLFKVRVCV